MDIYVNRNKLDFTLDQERTFGEVYESLKKWAEKGEKRIWGIRIDGSEMDVNKEDTFCGLDVSQVNEVHISLGESDSEQELIRKCTGLLKNLKNSRDLMTGLSENIHKDPIAKSRQKWQEILIILDDFNKVFPYFAEINNRVEKEQLTADFDAYKKILAELLQSMELEDNVTFSDLIIYELLPQVEKWERFIQDTKSALKEGS